MVTPVRRSAAMSEGELTPRRPIARRAILAAPLASLVTANACTTSSGVPTDGASSGAAPPPGWPSVGGAAPSAAGTGTAARAPTSASHVKFSPFSWRATETEYRGSSGAHLAALVRSRTVALLIESAGTVAYRANGGPWRYSAATGSIDVTLEPHLTWDTNYIEAVLTDSWGIFHGFALAPGGSIAPMPADDAPRLLALGDSITEGNMIGPDGTPHTTNALLAYPAALREVLGAEVGVSASGSRGWLNNSPLRETWASLDNGRMDFSSPPHAIVIMVGGGEPDARGLGDAVRSTLSDMVRTLPDAQILVLGHTNAGSPAVATVNAAVRSYSHSRVHFVDAARWINPAADTTDGVHHAGFVARSIMAPRIARELRRVLGSVSPGR